MAQQNIQDIHIQRQSGDVIGAKVSTGDHPLGPARCTTMRHAGAWVALYLPTSLCISIASLLWSIKRIQPEPHRCRGPPRPAARLSSSLLILLLSAGGGERMSVSALSSRSLVEVQAAGLTGVLRRTPKSRMCRPSMGRRASMIHITPGALPRTSLPHRLFT